MGTTRHKRRDADPLPDRLLIDRLGRRDEGALGRLYDRYAPLVFTLARDTDPETAEVVTEQVFVSLWREAGGDHLAPSLPRRLIERTAEMLPAAAPAHGPVNADAQLPALAPFVGLPPFVFDVAVMVYVGQLDVDAIAAAWEIDRAVVRAGLAAAQPHLRTAVERRTQSSAT